MSKNYYIKERLFAFGAKFDVYDEENKATFLIEADKFDLGKNINIYTPDKTRRLLYLEQQLRIGSHKYVIYDRNRNEIATVQKELMNPQYHISGILGEIEMRCDNAFLGRNYEVEKGGIIIGKIEKIWTFGRDKYSLEVYDESYTLLLIGLLTIVDMVRFHKN